MTTTLTQPQVINGINVEALRDLIAGVRADAVKGHTHWGVTTCWKGGTLSETAVEGCQIGDQWIERQFKFRTDEPLELGGTNTFANPQEYLLGALNACMTVGYVAAASLFGIELESLEIESKGEIDLRGFLGLDANVKAGYDTVHYTVRIKGNGTPAQFKEIHEIVQKTSPNRFNISQPVRLTSSLIVE